MLNNEGFEGKLSEAERAAYNLRAAVAREVQGARERVSQAAEIGSRTNYEAAQLVLQKWLDVADKIKRASHLFEDVRELVDG